MIEAQGKRLFISYVFLGGLRWKMEYSHGNGYTQGEE